MITTSLIWGHLNWMVMQMVHNIFLPRIWLIHWGRDDMAAILQTTFSFQMDFHARQQFYFASNIIEICSQLFS